MKRKEQGSLKVYETAGEQFTTRNALDPLFSIESESSANTAFVIDGGEIAVIQSKSAARLSAGLAWELRAVLNEYMNAGAFTVGGE